MRVSVRDRLQLALLWNSIVTFDVCRVLTLNMSGSLLNMSGSRFPTLLCRLSGCICVADSVESEQKMGWGRAFYFYYNVLSSVGQPVSFARLIFFTPKRC